MTTDTSTTAEQQFDVDDVFDSAGGGSGAPSFEWPAELKQPGNKVVPIIGGQIAGEVTDVFMTVVKDATTKEPKLNKRGKQMPQVNVTLQTTLRYWEGCKKVPIDEETKQELPASEDTGLRRIYVKYKMLDAIAAAIKESDQGKGGPRVGAKLAVKLTKLEDTGAPNPLPHYEARYVPAPVDTAADAFDNATAEAAKSEPAADPWANAAGGGYEPPF